MIPLDVLVKPVTSDDVFEGLVSLLEKVKIPARSWKSGSVAKSMLGVLAEFGARAGGVVSDVVGGMYLHLARGTYLTAHALDVYDVERIEATFATGEVTLTNTRGSRSFGANELIVRSTATKARFVVTEAVVLGSGTESSPTSLTVDVRAVESGAASSVDAGDIDDLETKLAGVTVTNEASIFGRDAESDDDLVARCTAKKGTWSSLGPRDAYESAILGSTLLDGSPTTISRVKVSRFSSTGRVSIVCATPNGAPSSDELTAARSSVEAKARPDSVTVTIAAARTRSMSNALTIWTKGGSETVIKDRALAALSAFYASYDIGGVAKTDGGQGYVYSDAIKAVVIGSSPEAFDVDPVDDSDVALDADEVAINTTTANDLLVRIR